MNEDKVTFPIKVPDGFYTGLWKKYYITIEVDGEEVVGKCVAGLVNDYAEFCTVEVKNGQAVARKAL